MARLTHDAIMKTFSEMLQEMPFDKVTVSELVRRCNISPNTFYYHYRDKYDLLNGWFNEGLERFISGNTDTDWSEIVKNILHLCKKHEIVTYHICNSLSREIVERFAFQQSDGIVEIKLDEIVREKNLLIPQEKKAAIANACRFMLLGFFIHFIWNKMTDDIDTSVDHVCGMLEVLLENELDKYSDRS